MERQPTVQWERMLPEEFRAAWARLPVAYVPLGTVEWHGEHNALGLDSLKAHALCVESARRSGGIVHPPVYGGMGGLDKPATVKMEPEHTWDNFLLRPWLETLCREFHRLGFKAVIILTGHYGHNQQIVVREVAARMSERLQIPVLGTPEYWLALDAGYHGDHAGIGETSLLWHLHPELVRIERLDADPEYGADDTIREGASPELGKEYGSLIVERLSALAPKMVSWSEQTLAGFARAERAIVRAQVEGWRRTDNPWQSWKKIATGQETGYGRLLVEGDFAGIEELAARLR